MSRDNEPVFVRQFNAMQRPPLAPRLVGFLPYVIVGVCVLVFVFTTALAIFDPASHLWIDQWVGHSLGVGSLFIVAPAFFLYGLPTVVAGPRHPRLGRIVLLNFFLGWTGIGWIAALIMARNRRR